MRYLKEPSEPLEAVATEGDRPDIPAAAATQAAFEFARLQLGQVRTAHGRGQPLGDAQPAGLLAA